MPRRPGPPRPVLVAVPPVATQDLTTEVLVDILAETRELAHARVVRQSDLAELAGAAPLTIFHGRGPGTVDLEP